MTTSTGAVAAQTRLELAMTLRRGESLLVTLAIPIGILVFFGKVDALTTIKGDPVDFLVPGVLALAVMASAMVSLGIATGFERRYGVLKRLGSTPLSRGGLLAAKTLNVLAIEVLQAVAIVLTGVALGWHVDGSIVPAIGLLLLGTVAFAGIGMLMAGTLRAEANLALGERPLPRPALPRRDGLPPRQAARRDRGRRPAAARGRAGRDRSGGARAPRLPGRRVRGAPGVDGRGTARGRPLVPVGRGLR